jgi:hypothetical protein
MKLLDLEFANSIQIAETSWMNLMSWDAGAHCRLSCASNAVRLIPPSLPLMLLQWQP